MDFNITILDTEYQRNGVGGQPFTTVKFTMTDDLNNTVVLLATVLDTGDESKEDNVMVINPFDFRANYRGDRIGAELLPKLKAWTDKKNETYKERLQV